MAAEARAAVHGARGGGAGRAVITIDGEVAWGRLSGLSATAAGPSRREGMSSRPIPVVSESATTAPCAQESLMSFPRSGRQRLLDGAIGSTRVGLEAVIGSFRLKLVLWFALLALVPLGGRLLRLRLARQAQRDPAGRRRPRVLAARAPSPATRSASTRRAARPRSSRATRGCSAALRGHDRATLRRLVGARPGRGVAGGGLTSAPPSRPPGFAR